MQPVKEQSTTDTDQSGDHGGGPQPPADFWRSLSGMPDPANHVAPPSIMQIRISALLEEQAEALLQDLRRKAESGLSAIPRAATEATEERATGSHKTGAQSALEQAPLTEDDPAPRPRATPTTAAGDARRPTPPPDGNPDDLRSAGVLPDSTNGPSTAIGPSTGVRPSTDIRPSTNTEPEAHAMPVAGPVAGAARVTGPKPGAGAEPPRAPRQIEAGANPGAYAERGRYAQDT